MANHEHLKALSKEWAPGIYRGSH